MTRYSSQYVGQLLNQGDYDALVQLQGILLGGSRLKASLPNYGLPDMVFVFVEALTWFAQTIRSGGWTYFEVTALDRQAAMQDALLRLGLRDLQATYAAGASHWRDPEAMKRHDGWVNEHEDEVNADIIQLLRNNSDDVVAFSI